MKPSRPLRWESCKPKRSSTKVKRFGIECRQTRSAFGSPPDADFRPWRWYHTERARDKAFEACRKREANDEVCVLMGMLFRKVDR